MGGFQAYDKLHLDTGKGPLIIVNLQIECFAKTESRAMKLEDDTKQILFNMGFYSVGFAQRFKNNEVHRYIGRYDLRYTGELLDLSEL